MKLSEKQLKDSFDYGAARRHLRQKQEAMQSIRYDLWQRAKEDSQKIIQMIVARYDPRKIIQWGSILEQKHFSEASDIDLAVEGVDAILFMRLLANAEELTKFPLDLLRWEEIDSSFQRIIEKKGRVVYAQG
ncbi:nucleotidyltransferase domain-containing protein [Deltaproteobacteria bacterium TL4]